MLESRGKGYIGKSMSVNAHTAYTNDEKPISKWRKTDILDIIDGIMESEGLNLNIDLVKKLTLPQLKNEFLTHTAPHHTGAFYQYTDFYTVNERKVKSVNDDYIEALIDKHKQYLIDTKAERQVKKAQREIQALKRRKEKEHKERVEELLEFSTYKTLNGLLNAIEKGRVDLLELEKKQSDTVEQLEDKRLRSELGQLRKFTEYKNVNGMIEALEKGQLDLKQLRLKKEREKYG